MIQQYPSQLLEKAVDEFAKLPGIGRKTALRLVLHLLRRDADEVERFVGAVGKLRREVKYCSVCHNISDGDVCPICSDHSRDGATICVVENVQDVMAVEATMQFHGLYHVLGGVISPMDGIGPGDIEIDSLVERERGHTGPWLNHGGRHHQLLYIQEVGAIRRKVERHCPRHIRRRRTGIHR